MFTEVELVWNVLVEPDVLKTRAHMHRGVILALLKRFNDVRCTPEHGYHVAVTTLHNVGEGTVWERRGCAAFLVRFRCVVFNVFRHEHVLAVVTQVMSEGVRCECGPIDYLFIAEKHLTGYEHVSLEVDSLQVLQWRKTSSGATIKRGDVIRVKILGTRWEPKERTLTAVGDLLGDYAGVDDRWPDNKTAASSSNVGAEGNNPWPVGGADDGEWADPLPNVDNIEASGWD